ncbi:MAG: TldD/PmbA family protein [Methanomassiliicoccales archaeon]|nr:MAG: TldD/PmbA family protein [Methanomassiliicoccales archaeon]
MRDDLVKAVEVMRDEGADFCDARHQTIERVGILVVDAGVRTITEDKVSGVCLRARVKGSWGSTTLIEVNREAMIEAASKAVRCARVGTAEGVKIADRRSRKGTFKADVKVHPSTVPIEEKLAAAMDLDRAQRIGPKVVNTNSIYREEVRKNSLANSFGDELEWEEVRTRLFVQTVASEGGTTEMFYSSMGRTEGFEAVRGRDIEAMGRETAEEAVKMLKAKKAPSGMMTCISDPVISGLLAHEVMGHASEADETVKRRSFLTDAVGKKVASEKITMIDDGSWRGHHGHIPFDDEGTPSSRTVIIENGVYKGYMQSLETASQMGAVPTGNGRAQDFGRKVFVRMTNTFFDKGDMDLEEMIEDVKFGVMTDKMINGMEDPVGGGFEAKTARGFLIENGEVTDMLRSFTLTGNALEILKTVDAVGKEVRLGPGTCGKGIEDWVPVSSGGPYCRSKIVLGGG